MARKSKAKARLDKFYHIAKEQGYRSRAAFKLIQLNRKYNFLGSATAVIDLCAAPGGWLQVASRFMPTNSIKIGVDLVAIKPIPGVITLQEDITTQKCIAKLRRQLKHVKADVVLNDGAPNVGAQWNKDAYSQNELVLMSLKLATHFLRQGGTFVTKIFRSTDYNSLMYVLGKFFERVEATKPQASRYASAEIFVVGLRYKAPETIDQRLFDPRSVFADTEADNLKELVGAGINSIDKILERRRHRQGYADDAPQSLFRRLSFDDFLKVSNPFAVFVDYNQLVLSPETLETVSAIVPPPDDLEELCADLKVLGRREIATLLKYRGRINRESRKREREAKGEVVTEKEELDSDAELEELVKEKAKRELNEQRREREKKLHQIIKSQRFSGNGDGMGDENQVELEELEQLPDFEDLGYVDLDEEVPEVLPPPKPKTAKESAAELEENLEHIYEMKKAAKARETARANRREEENEEENSERVVARLTARVEPDEAVESLETREYLRLSKWYQKGAFEGMRAEEDASAGKFVNPLKLESVKPTRVNKTEDEELFSDEDQRAELYKMPEPSSMMDKRRKAMARAKRRQEKKANGKRAGDEEEEEEVKDGGKEIEFVPAERKFEDYDVDSLAETLALAKKMLRKKDREEIIDATYDRRSMDMFEGAPAWFLEDEREHNFKILPITKEEYAAEKARLLAIEARPVKKVAEAKIRNKKRAMKKLKKAEEKAEKIMEEDGVSEAGKLKEVHKIYKKEIASLKREKKYVVARKGTAKIQGKSGKPSRFTKFVDRRMKKDKRAEKRLMQGSSRIRKHKSKTRQRRRR
eukprot:TRINITY_DN3334_c0_g1_i2.p1 TRINITY_DN3334_c0_g1~~TRINITY_DN3334_c0_g1_i2.p1  ORF type:complete len:816 (-),score=275.40 TRINITY_DN3334_c0_g1_i2:86-2533(-)